MASNCLYIGVRFETLRPCSGFTTHLSAKPHCCEKEGGEEGGSESTHIEQTERFPPFPLFELKIMDKIHKKNIRCFEANKIDVKAPRTTTNQRSTKKARRGIRG